ncbi:DNA-binding NarL/FixJ family response regulator [Algoriphagus iocasae]|uniref:DNA-binding NarL/FixJ family response regulator n=1 Tax=Algoriphagus iocasae TaxID=1836499 RepID=A0A841MIW9_9BACT|nr:response regulator transcription factor [Algoriphagus iocasae]MBB6328242.1 DNA-binding NarL/FixJ family response regulator [Algoriphagus iocasae]
MKTKVLVYDDNEMLRSSIRFLVESEPEMDLVASLPNAQSVEQDIVQYKPDVILMDIDMPLVNGVQAVARIRKIEEDLPVIMLTVFEDNENIFNAIYAGASGYILKRHLSEEIAYAIRTVLNGGAPMTGSVAKKVLKMLPRAKSQEQEKSNLTEKETKILELLVHGFSYKMIASEIFISIDTVRFHIKKIYEKLHVHSATEAVSKALKNRLVE